MHPVLFLKDMTKRLTKHGFRQIINKQDFKNSIISNCLSGQRAKKCNVLVFNKALK